jgi:mono/diheme cytochrome c family protein
VKPSTTPTTISRRLPMAAGLCALAVSTWAAARVGSADPTPAVDTAAEYTAHVRPILTKYCLSCHSAEKKKGDLNLDRFDSLEAVRKDSRAWQAVWEKLQAGEMPPGKAAQPSPEERGQLTAWVRGFLLGEIKAHAGDPGRVVVRRLSNAEYDNTIRDLTGVDLRPARDFPADGAAGEGFTNAGDALVMSPTLLTKYLNAAKEISAHAVLLPDGFRFSPSTARRDWTDETVTELRKTYHQFDAGPEDGRLDFAPYLAATIVHRDDLIAGQVTTDAVASQEKLNPKYLQILWQALTDKAPSFPLDRIRAHWRQASPKDAAAVADEIRAWQALLWKFNKIGSYMNPVWQDAAHPAFTESQPVRFKPNLAPGRNEVVLYLTARDLGGEGGKIVWRRPRFEGGKQPPLLLRDAASWGTASDHAPTLDAAYRTVYASTAEYLAAAEEVNDLHLTIEVLAKKHGVDSAVLKRWIAYLGLAPGASDPKDPAVPLRPLAKKLPSDKDRPAINGWGDNTPDNLPIVVSNASDQAVNIPGTVPPHGVTVHPAPTQFAGVVWKSPIDGNVKIEAKIAHAHPVCGNGVAWWLEHRHGGQADRLDGGTIDVGKKADALPREAAVAKGDLLLLAVGARDGNHSCDLTSVEFTITEKAEKHRTWSLAKDVANSILDGNPHADRLGDKEVWQFVTGPDPTLKAKPGAPGVIPTDSVLARWRSAAADPKRRDELGELGQAVKTLMTGERPADKSNPNRVLYESLASLDGPLFQGIDLAAWAKSAPVGKPAGGPRLGLDPSRFVRDPLAKADDADSLTTPATSVIEMRLPAALLKDREFVADGELEPGASGGPVQFEARQEPPDMNQPPVAGSRGAAGADLRGADPKRMEAGFDAFRRCFPVYLYHGKIVPDDEIICLRMFFREDDALVRLFLDDKGKQRLDRLWETLRWVSQEPLVEERNYPQFLGFVSQDGPEPLKTFKTRTEEGVHQRAAAFTKDREAVAPKHLDALLDFASRAYRRPPQEKEKTDLRHLYDGLRKKEMTHEDAFRLALTRVLVSPAFLYRVEQPSAGKGPQPVSSWEQATRLSYLLWATTPDAELRDAAAGGQMTDADGLAAQAGRMLKDPRTRGLATEFATQWLQVRDFRNNKEKNEKLFPTFDDKLRQDLFEETVLYFQDLFQNDRSVLEIVDSDHTFLDEELAKHYGVPNIAGPQWRRVDGTKQYGRGGVLTMGSILTTQSGASRTSPVLRGNWVVETLLGEKIPRPPPNVPKLPDDVTSSDELTVRQLTEKHTRVAECAVCHQRIDPYGFALEKYDPIGRLRDKDLGGRPIDCAARLRDGTQFNGVEGLRRYLLDQRKDDFLRHFCTKLLGYALGRSVALADQPLIDDMVAGLKANDCRVSVAVMAIIRSKQFRCHRDRDAAGEEEHP